MACCYKHSRLLDRRRKSKTIWRKFCGNFHARYVTLEKLIAWGILVVEGTAFALFAVTYSTVMVALAQ
jgi:hypothetical protein